MIRILLFILSLSVLTSCDFIKDSFTYKDKTQKFVETLLKKDYDKCITQMALESKMGANTNVDSLKIGLDNFRNIIETNFGKELEFTFIKSEKKRSTIQSENTPPNTTVALVEFSNDKELGVLNVLFDDYTKKIIHISTLDVKEEKPNMMIFWLFGIFPLLVLTFNIYVIRQIKKSTLTKKWWKYLAVMALNTPAISYAAIGGLSYKLINFQLLFGVGLSLMGVLGSVWTFGIPLGGIYWWWKIKKIKEAKANSTAKLQTPPDSQHTAAQEIEIAQE